MTFNSKSRLRNSKTFALFIVLFTSYLVKAQGIDDLPRLVNCYQDIEISPNSDNIVLRSDNNRIVLGNSKPRYVEINAFDAEGDLYYHLGMFPGFYFGLADTTFKEYYLPNLSNPELEFVHVVDLAYVNLETGESKENQNPLVIFEDIDHITLRFFFPTDEDPDIFRVSETATLRFRTADEAIQIDPITDENGCVSYNNFRTSYTNNLTGFCGRVRFTIENSEEPDTYDLIQETDELTPGEILPYEVPFDNYCPEACDPMGVPEGEPTTACGCRIFNLKTIIFPCNSNDPECSPLEFSKSIEICCTCDITTWNPDNTNFVNP